LDQALVGNDVAAAEAALERLEQSHSECKDIVLARAHVLELRGENAKAEDGFFQYIQAEPDDARGYSGLARLLLNIGAYQQADNLATAALSHDANSPEALIVKGQILTMQRRTRDARTVLEQACRLAPNNVEGHFRLGVLLDSMKRNQEAVAEFEKVTALNPGDPRGWDYLALNLEPLGELQRADGAYRKGLAMNEGRGSDSFLDYNYGRFLMKQNRLSESKTHLDAAIRLAPGTRAVHYERARLNVLLKNYADARTDAEQALALEDRSGVILDLQIYYLLSIVYDHLGEHELARKYAELSRTTTTPVQSSERK
jgi:tetratricopeptide (TPR) repeat protein